MKKIIIFIAMGIVILALGCVIGYYFNDYMNKDETNGKLPEGRLSEMEAINIAESSSCMADGTLTSNNQYDEISKIWSLEMDVDREYCFAFCHVSEETRKAETVWRCTGLDPSELDRN